MQTPHRFRLLSGHSVRLRLSSPFNFYVGNPALQPAFVQNAELSYTYKQQYSITAYYTSIQDVSPTSMCRTIRRSFIMERMQTWV
ncbi:outer membrane beta-barrel protein [Dyadobacter chenhuakuii]|uniref:outer membrane beta-barrel protein n=1 Tax=Dyadobacter chenhuakuii TaxID=2909339 RepID=UPI0035B59EAB